MLEGMTWMVALLAVMAGVVVFLSTVPVLLRRHEVAERLSHLFMPDRSRGTLAEAVLQGLERTGRSIEGARASRELRALVLRAGLFQPSALYIFVALRYVAAFAVGLGVVVARLGANGVSLLDILLGLFFGY